MNHIKTLVMLSCIALNAFAQTPIRTELFSIPISSIREDVKAIGMGKAQVGNGTQFNAMMYNPALLANERSSFELPTVQASLPTKSISAISFLADNLSQFTKGTFVKDIKAALRIIARRERMNGGDSNTPRTPVSRERVGQWHVME